MTPLIRIAIVDDNPEIREGLYHLINYTEGFVVVGTFVNCLNIVADIQSVMPDLVLMDIDMPKVSGIEATALLRTQFPHLHIVMLTVFENEERIFQAMQAGAVGYLLKKTPPAKILDGIKEAMEGGAPMSPSVARCVVRFFNLPRSPQADVLSPKEKQVLQALVNGRSYKMIAADLQISIGTVQVHIKRVYEKLHVHSAPEAVSKALREKLL
ncbi:MAG: response regulator transcription factor [Spirosomaceae bacterium]|jgi:DNA-binding NarL/FixJ family response regulator|nr:response regulator transcription factor [Spirosomataceae bacterium]